MRPVIFDTDIGTDVDDILALALLGKAEELQLIGVTTVYGDTRLRARIAKATADALGRPDLAIVAGASSTLSGRQVHWAGHEGEGIPNLDRIELKPTQSAEEYFAASAEQHSGTLEILATGPLTNIARFLTARPDLKTRIKRLYLMGGAYWLDRAEHNIKCDTEAARIVFASGVPITAIGLDVTLRVWMEQPELERISEIPEDLGPLLRGQVLRWWEYLHQKGNHLHDPLAALSMVRPDLFRFQDWDVQIQDQERAPGFTITSHQGAGKIQIAADVLAATAEKEIMARIAG